MASDPSSPEEVSPSVVTTRTVDLVVSALLLAGGIVLAMENWRIGARWSSEGPQTGFFPFYLSLILIGASLWGLGTALRAGRGDGASFIARDQLVRVVQVLLPTAIYVVAIRHLGIYVPSAILVVVFMRFLGGSSWLVSLVTGLSFAGIVFFLFDVQFRVVLPKGPIEAALGF